MIISPFLLNILIKPLNYGILFQTYNPLLIKINTLIKSAEITNNFHISSELNIICQTKGLKYRNHKNIKEEIVYNKLVLIFIFISNIIITRSRSGLKTHNLFQKT